MRIICLGVWGAFPKAGSATSSFLVEEKDFHLLIDCGSGVLAQLQKVIPMEQLDGLILSHYHHDHIADVGCLQYSMLVHSQLGTREKPLPIYAHQADLDAFNRLTFHKYTQGYPIGSAQSLEIGPLQVTFCPTEHPAYCLAMRISNGTQDIVLTADTEWSDPLVRFSKEADLLICESNLYNHQLGQIRGHMTAGEAGLLAELANVKRLILTHLPHHGELVQLVQQATENFHGPVQLAETGIECTIL